MASVDTSTTNLHPPTHNTTSGTQPSTPYQLKTLYAQLLHTQKYQDAMSIYNASLSLSTDNTPPLRPYLLQHIYELFSENNRDYSRIDNVINLFIADFYDDIDFLLLLSQSQIQQNQLYDSINTLQLAHSYLYTPDDKTKFNELYLKFIQHLKKTFSNERSWNQIVEAFSLIEDAGFLRTEEKLYLIELHLSYGSNHTAEAIAETLPANGETQQYLNTLFEKYGIKEEPNQATDYDSVALTKINNQFIIDVEFSGTNIPLLLDTGASITTISKQAYERLNLNRVLTFKSRQNFLTANGKTTGEIYIIEDFIIGNYRLQNLEIAVLDYPESTRHIGLLGMNVLGKFQFSIDQEKPELLIKK